MSDFKVYLVNDRTACDYIVGQNVKALLFRC